jgi:hypothetical protein
VRAWIVLGCLVAWTSVACAQGYQVTETNGRSVERPANAVRLDLDADAVGVVSLPFRFRYYGDDYDDMLVSASGWVRPGAARAFEGADDPETARGRDGKSGAFPYRPGGASADGIIAPFWAKSDREAVRVHTWTSGDAPVRRLIVSWEAAGGDRTVQLHLHEGVGRVTFAYSGTVETGAARGRTYVCGLDEPGGERFVAPVPGGKGRAVMPPSDFEFAPRTVLFNPPGIGREGVKVRWQGVRRESVIPDGCTKRCTYLARGRGYFHVPDRALVYRVARDGRTKAPPQVLERLLAEDRATFGGKKGDADRWVRQVLDGKMLFLPADGGEPLRVWFRIVEYFTIDAAGTAGADFHTWNLRWMLSNTFPGKDPREEIDSYHAWKAMAAGRLTVGKLFSARQADDAGRQYDSGRRNEYLLWSGRLKHGTRGALAKYASPRDGWRRFFLKEEDTRLTQHAEKDDLRFAPDPNYVDGLYEYVIAADDNPYGWIAGRGIPAPPLRDEGIDADPGRRVAPTTPR